MKLTGKCKEDFEKWFEVNPENNEGLSDIQVRYVKQSQLEIFKGLPDSMQFGVIVDFADSVGIELVVFIWRNKYTIAVYENDESKTIGKQIGKDKGFKSRPEAREKAVEKFNEIYNLNR